MSGFQAGGKHRVRVIIGYLTAGSATEIIGGNTVEGGNVRLGISQPGILNPGWSIVISALILSHWHGLSAVTHPSRASMTTVAMIAIVGHLR
jgi:hypothetical protein